MGLLFSWALAVWARQRVALTLAPCPMYGFLKCMKYFPAHVDRRTAGSTAVDNSARATKLRQHFPALRARAGREAQSMQSYESHAAMMWGAML